MNLNFLPGARAKREFAAIIESFHKDGTVSPEQCNTEKCKYRATMVKDLVDYAEKNFGKEELTKQYLQTACNSCMECTGTPEDNNCEDVFRRVGLAGHYLINS
ncbi:MAG: hypothetical protein ABIE55_00805 [Candidatus Aenigmatarchaeota archaeon]